MSTLSNFFLSPLQLQQLECFCVEFRFVQEYTEEGFLFLIKCNFIFPIFLSSTEGTGVAPFFLTSVSCICWLGYGILKKDQTIIFVNGIGLVFQTVYLAYYYMKTRLKVFF